MNIRNKIIALFEKYRELIVYVICGGLTTAVNFGIYYIMRTYIAPSDYGFDLILSNSVSWLAAVLFAFYVNKIFVFRDKNTGFLKTAEKLFGFAAMRLFSGGLETLLLWLFVTLLLLNDFIVKIFISVLVVILNYIFSKVFIFAKK